MGILTMLPSDREWWTAVWLSSISPRASGKYQYNSALLLTVFEENPLWTDDLPCVVVNSERHYVWRSPYGLGIGP